MHKVKLRALEGRRVSSKNLSPFKTEMRELLEGMKEKIFLLEERSFICPPVKLFFTKSKENKIAIVFRPGQGRFT